jgi:hypothetical protein
MTIVQGIIGLNRVDCTVVNTILVNTGAGKKISVLPFRIFKRIETYVRGKGFPTDQSIP